MGAEIDLTLVAGSLMCFNAKDYIKLRRDHRIVGNLIGVISSHPNDSTIRGLPAIYNCYEAGILMDNKIVQVVDKERENVDTHCLDERREKYKRYVMEQEEYQRDHRSSTATTEKKRDTDVLYQIPMKDFQHSPAVVDDYSNTCPVSKFRIFKDLWERGHFVTLGNSFGGDFLLYPTDPLLGHATHVVHVLAEPKVPAKTFINNNRLCVGVKKACLFAYIDAKTNEIVYQTSEWDSSWDTNGP